MTAILLPAMSANALLSSGIGGADPIGARIHQAEFAAIFGDMAAEVLPLDLPVMPDGPPAPAEGLVPDGQLPDVSAFPQPDSLMPEVVAVAMPDDQIPVVSALPLPGGPIPDVALAVTADVARSVPVRDVAVVVGNAGGLIAGLRLAGEARPPPDRGHPVLALSQAAPLREPVVLRDMAPPMPDRLAMAPAAPPAPPRSGPADPVIVPPDALPADVAPPAPEPAAVPAPQEARRGSETVTLHRSADAPPPAERQIAAAVVAAPSGRTEILLDPKELGRVRVSLEGDESALVLTIQAERSETADLLRRNADILVQEFRDAGYENLSFSFSDHPRDADHGMDDDPAPSGPTGPVEIVADFSPPRPGAGTLDLRL